MNDTKYPLYPELPEPAAQEAQDLVNKFKEKLKKAAEEVISDLYCDVVTFIESDSWINFRNQIMDGFKNYHNRKITHAWDFKTIRQEIYRQYRDEIIADLNQDLVGEVESLKKTIEDINKFRYR